jgi:hypothetical protein
MGYRKCHKVPPSSPSKRLTSPFFSHAFIAKFEPQNTLLLGWPPVTLPSMLTAESVRENQDGRNRKCDST